MGKNKPTAYARELSCLRLLRDGNGGMVIAKRRWRITSIELAAVHYATTPDKNLTFGHWG